MPIVAEKIELKTHSKHKVLLLADIEKSLSGDHYTCLLMVRSGHYSCERPFCFEGSYLHDAVGRLRHMDEGVPGTAVLKGQWDDDCLGFESNDMGHVTVTGELYERSDTPQSLRFAFQTDQTVLGSLIKDLDYILRA